MRGTGVSRATIYHYLDVGLLPQPERPNLRMAYYDPDCIDRVNVIRRLKEQRFMPLEAIRRVLDDGGVAGLRAVDSRLLDALGDGDTQHSEEPLCAEALLDRHPVDAGVLESLAGAGLLGSAEGPFSADEVSVVAAVHEMRRAGLDEGLGFSVDQLSLYPAALRSLIDLEFAVFNERVLGAVSPERASAMAKVAVEATSELLAALHRRLLRERLEGLAAGADDTESHR